jgi:hypothetical protein
MGYDLEDPPSYRPAPPRTDPGAQRADEHLARIDELVSACETGDPPASHRECVELIRAEERRRHAELVNARIRVLEARTQTLDDDSARADAVVLLLGRIVELLERFEKAGE